MGIVNLSLYILAQILFLIAWLIPDTFLKLIIWVGIIYFIVKYVSYRRKKMKNKNKRKKNE